MKIKFEYNENDLFVKKSKVKPKKKKYNKSKKEGDENNIARKISIILLIILLIIIIVFIILINKFGQGQNEFDIDDFDEKNEKLKNTSIIYFKAISRKENLLLGKKYISRCLNDSMTKKYEKVDNPIISVIIPVFNCEKSIKYAISSIQNQNVTNIEIILINDFSSDNSLKIIEEIQKRNPKKR